MNKVKKYNKINDSFKKRIIFHVGTGAGFYSEINGMLRAMLYCYAHKIKFILYADDASFAGGNGWNEFFVSFCPQSHDKLNQWFNQREKVLQERRGSYFFGQMVLKYRNRVDYLTNDIFGKTCLGAYNKEKTYVKWNDFGINGELNNEFVKLKDVALRYNKKTFLDIKEKINSIKLPEKYFSIQFRGGDKSLEYGKAMDVNNAVSQIKKRKIVIDNLFIFTDDFRYVEEIREKCPEWNIYTLTGENERGYNNTRFNNLPWALKRRELIKLFAMVEICLNSEIHFGCEVASVNDYIKNLKLPSGYIPIWTEKDAHIRKEIICDYRNIY